MAAKKRLVRFDLDGGEILYIHPPSVIGLLGNEEPDFYDPNSVDARSWTNLFTASHVIALSGHGPANVAAALGMVLPEKTPEDAPDEEDGS